jgi:hypothetical protein
VKLRTVAPAEAGAGMTGALAGVTLLLAACGSAGPPVKSEVLTPAPATPSKEFFVEKADVRSRETGDDAWRRNQEYGRQLSQSLRDALTAAGKNIAPPPALVIRPQIYLAWEDPPRKNGVSQGEKARVEIVLQLVDPETRAVRYSTLTKCNIATGALLHASEDDRDLNVSRAIDKAVENFVSRL